MADRSESMSGTDRLLEPSSLGRRSLADVAYERIRSSIAAGRWPPGSFLREQELTKALQMSRTPIREALRRLQADNIVEVGRAGGAVIPHRGIDDLIHDYMIRAEIEGLGAALAAERITEDELAQLEQMTTLMLTDLDGGSTDNYLALNEQFHALIVAASAYPRLITFHEVLLDSIRMVSRRELATQLPDALRAAAEEHLSIIVALRARDSESARLTARSHVLAGVDWMRTHARTSDDDPAFELPNDVRADGPIEGNPDQR